MKPCLSACSIAGAAVALLAWPPPMQAAIKPATPTELRAEILRLQAVVSVCAASTEAAASACDPASVGDDLRIGDPEKDGYAVHWGWVRSALEKSKTAERASRGYLMRDAGQALGRMQTELDAEPAAGAQRQVKLAHDDAAAVLAAPEFQRDNQPTWWDKLKARFYSWLGRLFMGVERAGEAAPWLWPVLKWSLIVLAAAGLLFFLLRILARQRLRISLQGAALATTAWDREATDWAAAAEEFAAKSEWRDAVHCLYWASIVSLEARRAWRHNPTRTPREYVRLLKSGSQQQQGLRSLTRLFERVWYGLRDTRADEYTEARALYGALAAAHATQDVAPAKGESADPLPSGGAA